MHSKIEIYSKKENSGSQKKKKSLASVLRRGESGEEGIG